jgi:hypothetical protein
MTADDGSTVTLYRDASGAWYVERPGDHIAYYPLPVGAFATEAAARNWADRRFPGGSWDRAC